MTSGEFAKLCGTSKETLRHYKDIGLLMPDYQDHNGYQYYHAEQFYDYYAIAIFKKTGTPLATIKECMTHQNVHAILATMNDQKEALAKEKRKLEQMEFVVKNSIANMNIALSYHPADFTPKIAFFKKEHLLAVPHYEFSISKEENDHEYHTLIPVLQTLKEICDKYDVQTDYQLGAMMQLDNKHITHLYTRINKTYQNPYYTKKPEGMYLYIIQKGEWELSSCYQMLFSYIEEYRIKTTGSIYAYDLAGFMVNGVEENSMTIISVPVIVP